MGSAAVLQDSSRGLLHRLRLQQVRLGLYLRHRLTAVLISADGEAGQPLVHLHSESLKLDFVYVNREPETSLVQFLNVLRIIS